MQNQMLLQKNGKINLCLTRKNRQLLTYALTYVAWPGAAEQLPHLISEADLSNFLKISALVRSFFSCLT